MNSQTLVVKVGTSTLTHSNGALNLQRVGQLVTTLSDIKNMGHHVVLVTSGAIGVGVNRLKFDKRPDDLPTKQAAAAIGQSELMNIYSRFFSDYGHCVAQILLTLDVIENEIRRHNAENTFRRLLDLGAVPIVNENDTISTFEIENMNSFGENDTLAAVVARLVDADRLVLLSDIDGLYDANPRKNPNARLIKTVTKVDTHLSEMAGGAGSALGSGGMATKLSAALIATQGGIPMNIVNGEHPEYLYDILNGLNPGTEFICAPLEELQ
ncbi:MAG: glutamate 5-kinase [Clostridia bacterium]|nr:glutamate 5-kinase [Clostridia bacterium]